MDPRSAVARARGPDGSFLFGTGWKSKSIVSPSRRTGGGVTSAGSRKGLLIWGPRLSGGAGETPLSGISPFL